jgi:hypothetical protein
MIKGRQTAGGKDKEDPAGRHKEPVQSGSSNEEAKSANQEKDRKPVRPNAHGYQEKTGKIGTDDAN